MPRTCGTKIGHVRVCGGSGRVTARFYPALFNQRVWKHDEDNEHDLVAELSGVVENGKVKKG
jgi:hypothetical protein